MLSNRAAPNGVGSQAELDTHVNNILPVLNSSTLDSGFSEGATNHGEGVPGIFDHYQAHDYGDSVSSMG